jgi:translation initiation factor IF-3
MLYFSSALRHGGKHIDKRFIRMNERIRAREVRVIDSEGEQLGVMTPFDALKIAREKNLDLVEISPTANPPVCRIMDYGKFLYDLGKKEKAAKKTQKVITIKEVKFSINVDQHDFETKRNRVIRFLQEGDKVKASLRFKGREMSHRNLGREVLDRLVKDVGTNGTVEFGARMEGNTMHVILAPIKKEPVKAAKPPKAPQPQQQAAPAAEPATTTQGS